MGIKDLIGRFSGRNARLKEIMEENRNQELAIERTKSANERELERYMKEEREKHIKAELEEFRKRKRKEIEFGHQILHTKNMFANDKPRILNQRSLFGGKGRILK